MGCGSSTHNQSARTGPEKIGTETLNGLDDDRGRTRHDNGHAQNHTTKPTDDGDTGEKDPSTVTPRGGCNEGKDKHMNAPSMRVVDQDEKVYYLALFANDPDTLAGLTFVCRDAAGTVWMKSMTDEEVEQWKTNQRITLRWPTFWRSLAAAFSKGEPPRAIAAMGGKKRLDVTLKTKESRLILPVELPLVGADSELTFKYFVQPFFDAQKRTQQRKGAAGGTDAAGRKGDVCVEFKEAKLNLVEADIQRDQLRLKEATVRVESMNEDARLVNQDFSSTSEQANNLEKQLRKVKKAIDQELEPHHLDGLYNTGGARYFQHTRWACEHEPKNITPSDDLLTLLTERFRDTENNSLRSLNAASDPAVKRVLESAPNLEFIHEVINIIDQVDEYDFDPFALDEKTNGGALLYTAWALTHKYDLCNVFNIDQQILLNFWVAITAGYHPNPYHNATHAADVLQCTHYIIGPGKMSVTVRMKKEDILSSLIAAGIHDFDHPGFNNSFHTRTSAYLGTLYNDRSVLENHHCACAFEIMRHDKFNICASLTDEQRKEVRDTVVELLLSTDMGNHAKIFHQFRRMVAENPDWSTEKKKDIKLIMVMAIKMADISNCSRRRDLYLRWADRIAEEFYNQGNTEEHLGIPVSPFMDRKKHNVDFAKGQISFMNYIVLPMFNDVAQLLPALRPLVTQCEANRGHWSNQQRRAEAAQKEAEEKAGI